MAMFRRKLIALPEWLLFTIVAAIAGTLDVWLLIGWREINPGNLSWLSGDPAQYEVGWEFLRHEKVWSFPLTWITRLDYPSGVSASNLDFIPLVGVPLRFFASALPVDFQYLGLYAVTCYCLQTFFGLKLVSMFSKEDRIITLLGAAFFLLSPILTERLYGHFPHSTHWILLACLYYYFRFSSTKTLPQYLLPFVVLAIIAAAVTPYIALMAVLLGLAAIWRAHLEGAGAGAIISATPSATRDASVRIRHWFATSYLLWAAILLAATLLSLTVFGFIVFGHAQFAGDGYTNYSMNILSPINPNGASLYFRTLPSVGAQAYESYNYLGIGVLLLLAISLARNPELIGELWSIATRPLVIASILLSLLAISLKVTIADQVLFTIPAPKFIFHLLAAFRSSGRLFWPVNYLLVLGAIVGVVTTIPSRFARHLILASALLLQYFDLLPLRDGIAAAAQKPHINELVSSDWTELPKHYRHLVILPAMQCEPDQSPGGLIVWANFARLAARGDMTLNSAYLGRVPPQTHILDCAVLPQNLMRDGLRSDTAYVLSDALAATVSNLPHFSHYCRRVDGFNLCTYNSVRDSRSPVPFIVPD
jgi:hypothetical protein